ncbi:MAG TPA: hypothetical protein VEL07_16420 [Planctomycetota bacterium]|nr:hypothetical protein [Planctomycetota bacterium]
MSKKNLVVQAVLSVKTVKRIDALATKLNMTRSKLLGQLVHRGLGEEEDAHGVMEHVAEHGGSPDRRTVLWLHRGGWIKLPKHLVDEYEAWEDANR